MFICMDDPSFWSRIYEFGAALFGYWWALVAGGLFAIEPMIEPLLGQRTKYFLDKWSLNTRKNILRSLSVVAILLASFLAFDNVNSRLRNVTRECDELIHAANAQSQREEIKNGLKALYEQGTGLLKEGWDWYSQMTWIALINSVLKKHNGGTV
jgi:hypothetical protein